MKKQISSIWLLSAVLLIILLLVALVVTNNDPPDQDDTNHPPLPTQTGSFVTLANQYRVSVDGVDCTSHSQETICRLSWSVENVGADRNVTVQCYYDGLGEALGRHFVLRDAQGNNFSDFDASVTAVCLAFSDETFASGRTLSGQTDFYSTHGLDATTATFEFYENGVSYQSSFSL